MTEKRDSSTKGSLISGSKIAKSSLVDRDPFGDQPWPEPTKKGAEGEGQRYSKSQLLLLDIQDKT